MGLIRSSGLFLVLSVLGLSLLFQLGCSSETQVVEVIKEVPVDVVREVVKEVPVQVIKEVPVDVIKEVPVEVVKEVVKEVQVVKEIVREVLVQPDVAPETFNPGFIYTPLEFNPLNIPSITIATSGDPELVYPPE